LAWTTLLILQQGCAPAVSPSRPDLPPAGPFAETLGTATGDVTSGSALVWTSTNGQARVKVEWQAGQGPWTDSVSHSAIVSTTEERDFTASILLDGLTPATSYRYRVLTAGMDQQDQFKEWAGGSFRTAALPDSAEPVRFAWSGDIGGQHRCRNEVTGYAIFDRLRAASPSFALLLGDLVYEDDRCPSPPNLPGSDFTSATLAQYRAKHRYQHGDPAFQRFLRDIPVYVTWDDHEVRDNFSGPDEPLMPIGRRAFMEYWPIHAPADDPNRLYRHSRHGADLEVFILDTRQYRSRNERPDDEGKTMLGEAQRKWLIDGLIASTATWKVVATSVPLSIRKKGNLRVAGNDSWARGADGTGFTTELRNIVNSVKQGGVRNIVWLAADVHFAQVNTYDPDSDGQADFYEFVAGPLSAASGRPVPPEPDLRPTTLYSAGGFANFGLITISGKSLKLEIIDDAGTTRFAQTFQAR
jgi:alkaline phosphatase D